LIFCGDKASFATLSGKVAAALLPLAVTLDAADDPAHGTLIAISSHHPPDTS